MDRNQALSQRALRDILIMSRGKNCLPCLKTIFDSQLPSPELSPKMTPKLALAHKRGQFSSFKITPAVRVIARQLRDKSCLAAILSRDIKMSVLAHWGWGGMAGVFVGMGGVGVVREKENHWHSDFTPEGGVEVGAAKRGGFKRGGFPVWTFLSFFVLFCPFLSFLGLPIFPGFSRFARGWSGNFPDSSLFLFVGLL